MSGGWRKTSRNEGDIVNEEIDDYEIERERRNG
jgi:hypothetical protein